jgi:hypothetical protein
MGRLCTSPNSNCDAAAARCSHAVPHAFGTGLNPQVQAEHANTATIASTNTYLSKHRRRHCQNRSFACAEIDQVAQPQPAPLPSSSLKCTLQADPRLHTHYRHISTTSLCFLTGAACHWHDVVLDAAAQPARSCQRSPACDLRCGTQQSNMGSRDG